MKKTIKKTPVKKLVKEAKVEKPKQKSEQEQVVITINQFGQV